MAQPLKILGLTLRNFLAHESTDLDLAQGGIVWITGCIGEGKTSIKNAIEYAFLAGARGAKRGDAEDLIFDPTIRGGPPDAKPRRMGVQVRALIGDKEHEVSRTKTRESHSKVQLAAYLGVPDLDILAAVLDAGTYGTLDREARLRLIDRTLGNPITDAELLKAGIDDPEIRIAAMRSVKSALARATERRRDIERDLPKDLPEAPADPIIEGVGKRASEVDPVALGPGIETARMKRNALAGEIERLKGMGAGKVAALESVVEERKALLPAKEAAVKAAADALSAFRNGDRATAAKKAETDLPALRVSTKPYRDGLTEARGACTAADAALEKAKADLARAEKAKDGPCPLCTHPIAAAELLAIRKEQVQEATKALAAAEKDRGLCEESVAKADDAETALQHTIDLYAEHIADLEADLTRATEALQDARDEIRDGEKAVADAKAAVADPTLIAAKAEDLAKQDARLAKATAAYDAAMAYREALRVYQNTSGALLKARTEADRYRRYEALLGEDGILATRTAGGIALLQGKVEEFSARACPPGMSVGLDADGDILYCGKPVSRASEGERWTASAIVAAALSNLSGLKFLFLDSMSALDAEARDRMFLLLAPLVRAGDLVQVFVVTLRDRVGLCEACGGKTIREANGMCRLHPEFPVTTLRPVGSMVDFVRIFEFVKAGSMREVLPVPTAATA